MTQPITALRDAYAGQKCYIVGKGPSLLNLTTEHFGPGPIITLNQALRKVESLRLPNPLLSMQKDGSYPIVCGSPCEDCTVMGPRDMIVPEPGAALLVSKANSEWCFIDYQPRYVFDSEQDFGLDWYMPSALVALKLAELFGCTALTFVSMDACTTGDTRLVNDGVAELRADPRLADSYLDTAVRLRRMLKASPIRSVEWVTPS